MFAVIYIPNFFLQSALRHTPELYSRRVALLDEQLKAIIETTAIASESGIGAGLTSTQALARCSTALIYPRSIPQESSAMNILLECAFTFSPSIEATAPGICTLDLQGLSDAGHKSWGEKIIAALAQFNLRARIGVAKNPDLALHAAKIAQPFFCVDNSRDFIASLPVESIEPPPDILNLLKRWGIRTLGEFTALQKSNLAERLGPEALELFDRASAREIRPLTLTRPKEVFEESAEFETEIETLEPLLFIMRRFIEQLSRRLELFYFVAEEIALGLTLSSAEKYECVFRVPVPTRNIETLFRMLQTHLENVRTESPIIALQLSAKPTRSQNLQFGLFETGLRDPNHFHETLAALSALCGNQNVGTPILENTFRPDAFKMETPRFDSIDGLTAAPGPLVVAPGLCLRRFRPPVRATVEMREGKPTGLHSEKVVAAVTRANGPFRLSGDWWEQEKLWNRDEWDIETSNGELFRLFAENNQWFLEGVYD